MFAGNGGVAIESRAQNSGTEVVLVEVNQRVEVNSELQFALRQVHAPPELWDRVQSARVSRPQTTSRGFVWALALAVVLAAVALSLVRPPVRKDPPLAAFHCQNPVQLRAWVKANTGFDVPLRAALPAPLQLIGVQMLEGTRGVEIAYRAGNRDATLLVSRADPGSASVPHSSVNGTVSSWVMDGQRFTLACNDPAGLRLACKLCHLD
jgi:hypothetical protein